MLIISLIKFLHKRNLIDNDKKKMLYDGKAKTIFEGPTSDTVIQYFKDDATANNAEKHAIIDGKGVLNNSISDFLMRKIQEIGIYNYIKK